MKLEYIKAEGVAPAVGPYSHAIAVDRMVYCSGCLALNEDASFAGGDAVEQAKLALKNMEKVLASAGCTPDRVVKTTIFLTDMGDFATVNQVYSHFFGDHRPARSCVAVASLPLGASVEVEAIAMRV